MTSTPESPKHDGEDLAALREEIDELKETPTEDLIDPVPAEIAERITEPYPTDAIGSEDWDQEPPPGSSADRSRSD